MSEPDADQSPATDPVADREPPTTCALCGATAAGVPLGWSTSAERGRTLHHCPTCSRAHVRDMESKLDTDWW